MRSSTQFRAGGHRVGIKTFCFLHSIGVSKFNSIKASFQENGLRPRHRPHTTPHNATKLSDVPYVVHFILQHAEENAILLPGRIPGYKRDDLLLLPSSTTKREVWELYHRAAGETDAVKAVGYSLFCSLRTQLTPQVVVTKPMSDLCWTCQQNSTAIMRAQNRPEEEKSEVRNVLVSPHKKWFDKQYLPIIIAVERLHGHKDYTCNMCWRDLMSILLHSYHYNSTY